MMKIFGVILLACALVAAIALTVILVGFAYDVLESSLLLDDLRDWFKERKEKKGGRADG